MYNDELKIKTIENIKTTMAIEKHFLLENEVTTLHKCMNEEMTIDDAILNVKNDILGKM